MSGRRYTRSEMSLWDLRYDTQPYASSPMLPCMGDLNLTEYEDS